MTLRLSSMTIHALFVVLFLLPGHAQAPGTSTPRFKAVAFDYFVILMPTPSCQRLKGHSPERELNLPGPGAVNSLNTVFFARSRTIMKTFSK